MLTREKELGFFSSELLYIQQMKPLDHYTGFSPSHAHAVNILKFRADPYFFFPFPILGFNLAA